MKSPHVSKADTEAKQAKELSRVHDTSSAGAFSFFSFFSGSFSGAGATLAELKQD